MKSTITITFSEAVENHTGNQIIGQALDRGLTVQELKKIKGIIENDKYECKYIDLSEGIEDAGILIVKNFLRTKMENEKMLNGLKELDWDKKVIMRGRVVNKHARYNLCFADFEQEPDYEQGKGRVYNFADEKLEELRKIRTYINNIMGIQLSAEGNLYYDTEKCYIGFHGDGERRIVVGLRIGEKFPLYYQWYKNSEPITEEPYCIELEGGDLYIMSDKATGHDWKKRKIYTLRHAAGKLENYKKK